MRSVCERPSPPVSRVGAYRDRFEHYPFASHFPDHGTSVVLCANRQAFGEGDTLVVDLFMAVCAAIFE